MNQDVKVFSYQISENCVCENCVYIALMVKNEMKEGKKCSKQQQR